MCLIWTFGSHTSRAYSVREISVENSRQVSKMWEHSAGCAIDPV